MQVEWQQTVFNILACPLVNLPKKDPEDHFLYQQMKSNHLYKHLQDLYQRR